MKRNLKGLAVVAALAATAPTMASADVATGNIDLRANGNPYVRSVGQVVFTLQGDGTVDAVLTDTDDNNIRVFGFDSTTQLDQSHFSDLDARPASTNNPSGYYATGFVCNSCLLQFNWTIGNVGEFTSVSQLFTGNTASLPVFLQSRGDDDVFGDLVFSNAVPEPAAWALMLLGVGGLGASLRSRRKAAIVAVAIRRRGWRPVW